MQRELSQAREQLEAASDVLRVIAASPGDAEGSLRKIAEIAARLFGAVGVSFRLADGEDFKLSVGVGQGAEQINANLYADRPVRPTVSGRNLPGTVIRENRLIHLPDLDRLDKEFADWPGPPVARRAGIRTVVGTPLRTKEGAIGALIVYRNVLRPFEPSELQLLQSFADQAAIAIEDARLLAELRESLEQQTATSEVLQVISRSTFDLKAVLSTLVESAARLCLAGQAALFLRDGDVYRLATTYGFASDAVKSFAERPLSIDRTSMTGRVALAGKVVHVHDVLADPEYQATDYQQAFGYRTNLGVPLLRDGTTIGVFALVRSVVKPFTDKQIDLVTTFADQAVIAIENARLLSELRESLDQQTATSEVLKVISSSQGDLQPVFSTMLDNAVRICGASFGTMLLFEEGGLQRRVAMHKVPPAYLEFSTQNPVVPSTVSAVVSRVRRTKQAAHTVDLLADHPNDPLAKFAGARSVVTVPMLKDNEAIGIFGVFRQEVREFTDKQIELVKNFAAQAVIAIENARLLTELRESLAQQTATSEVLQVISASPGELSSVFEVMLENATRMCEAKFGNLWLREGDKFRIVATHGASPKYRDYLFSDPLLAPDPQSALGRAADTHEVVQIDDISNEPTYGIRTRMATVELMKPRSFVVVPMLKENALIGVIVVYRQEVRPFTDKQVALLTNFAAQAVIAIENARLLSELRQSLEQQTATSEVLGVISRSKFELQPVLQSVVDTAERLCRAEQTVIYRLEDGVYRFAAGHSSVPEYLEVEAQTTISPGHGTVVGRAALTRQVARIADAWTDPLYEHKDDARLGGVRSMIGVPLMREGEPIGVIALARSRVEPFTDREIDLVTTFADQAVIAIENVRLFEAEQQRTRELTESLEQQTATSEVLQVISSSPGDLQPVFDAMLENAVRICGAKFGIISRWDGEALHMLAAHNTPPALAEARKHAPRHIGANPLIARMLVAKAAVQVPDAAATPGYLDRSDPGAVAAVDLGGARTAMLVPMLKENEVIGSFALFRQEVRSFTEKQMELVNGFASQAVIAIENARLLTELRESLEQQTATAEVLRVISSSPGDLEPVFASMLENAVRISSAKFGIIHSWDGEHLRLLATHDLPPALDQARKDAPAFKPGPKTGIRRMLESKSVVHIPDLREDAGYREQPSPQIAATVEQGGVRTMLVVPMLMENQVVGVFTVYRQEVRDFSDKQIELVKNFASQAVIAIENTRLLTELRRRTDDLTESLEQQTAISEILGVISNSPSDVQPVLAAVAEYAARICQAQIVDVILVEGDKLRVAAQFGELGRDIGETPVDRSTVMGRSICDMQPVHLDDQQNAPDDFARGREFAIKFGHRTIMAVPLIREGHALGTILVRRAEVRPFEQKHIALLKTFADQAAIAIANVRLFKAEQQRTRELSESLEQQTATAEVLGVISSSPGNLEPVFRAMLESATRICQAQFGVLSLREDAGLRVVAMHNPPVAYAELRRREPIWVPTGEMGRIAAQAIATRRAVQVPDLAVHNKDDALIRAFAMTTGARSLILVPLLKEGEVIGTSAIYRQEVRPFTDKQVELLTSFAAQAVIAIENARLLTELRESLEQQTATAEVLSVINASRGDLQPVFEAMVEKARLLCEADAGHLALPVGDDYRSVAVSAMSPEMTTLIQSISYAPGRGTAVGRALAERRPVQISDIGADNEHIGREAASKGFIRTILGVPLLRQGEAIGAFGLSRQRVEPFSDRQIDLVRTFADQAVIAIENTRLLNELRARTDDLARSVEELRALGETSQAVNSTLDLEMVLNTIVTKAAQLSGTEAGAIYVFDEGQREFHLRATYGMDQELIEALGQAHIGIDEQNIAVLLANREPLQVEDLSQGARSAVDEIVLGAGYRARLATPLFSGDDIVGLLVVRRRTPGAFAQNTVALMKTFAAQSALAIQNAGLFHEIEEKGRELEVASKHKSQFLANMSHELRTPLNAILGYTELILDNIYGEAPEKMRAVLVRVQTNGKHLLGLINDVLDLSKIEAGQLTLSLSDYSVAELVQGVFVAVEPLASQKSLALTTKVEKGLPMGRGDERRLAQVLLNLVGNAIKFTDKGGVAIEASQSDGAFNIAVRDSGPGIAAADQKKIFEEFQQIDNTSTRQKGGTGLGLSISRRIVELHGGSILLDSHLGKGSTFTIRLPVAPGGERQVA